LSEPRLPARILIVDDAPVARNAIRALLDCDSFQVCGEAKNGKEAVDLVGELKPDVVLLDINMPVMDGLTAAGEIRRLSPATKIVFLTLHDDFRLQARTRLFSDGFVAKSEAGTKLIPTLTGIIETIAAPKPTTNRRSIVKRIATTTNDGPRYPWQQLVSDAVTETNAKQLTKRINAAERAISARRLDLTLTEADERLALKEALEVLRSLISETSPKRSASKEEIV
jgi:two-component system chemotaxis response regulator CheY